MNPRVHRVPKPDQSLFYPVFTGATGYRSRSKMSILRQYTFSTGVRHSMVSRDWRWWIPIRICRFRIVFLPGLFFFSHRNGHEDIFHRCPNGHSEQNFLCSPRRKWRKWIRIKKLEPGFPVFRQAVPAVNRSSLGWLKWYFAFFPTVWTGYFCHLTWAWVSWAAEISRAAIVAWSEHNFSQTVDFL